VTTLAADLTGPSQPGCWHWPIDPHRYDTTPVVRAAEAAAIVELGTDNVRRLARHEPAARGWAEIRRLLRPLDEACAALESPLTPHRRRAMLDATAVVLLRCAETGRSYWSWTDEEWADLLGQDQRGFRKAAPAGPTTPYALTWPRTPSCSAGLPRSAGWAVSAASPWPGASSAATAWTARSAGSARYSLAGATGSAVRATRCCRWSPARCSCSTAARTPRS
jgi:hypothetical protein